LRTGAGGGNIAARSGGTMRIGEIMNVNAARIRLGSTMRQAAEVVASTQVSDLMVVDEENNFVGVLSEGDLIRAVLPRYEELMGGEAMSDAFEGFLDKGKDMANHPVEGLVIKSPITVSPSDPVLRAASTMISKQIRRLPVVDKGKLVGTVARADICRGVLSA
jgi:CBS domain-containing protein